MNNQKLPDWELNSLYASLECEDYKNDVNELNSIIISCKELLSDSKNLADEKEFSDWLKTFINKQNQLYALAKTINAYAYIIYSTETTNTNYMNNLDEVSKILTKVKLISLDFQKTLVANKNYLENFYLQNPDFAEYKYFLSQIIEEASHSMSDAEEELASEMSQTGGEAWSLLQEQIISNLHDEKGKTFNDLRADACSKDKKIRCDSYKKEIELLKQFEIPLAASLNNLKGETLTLNKKRNWTKPLEKSLFTSRLSEKTINALIESIEETLPEWRKYFQAKATLLRKLNQTESKTSGTKENPGLAFYDLFAPLDFGTTSENKESPVTKEWTFEEAENYVVKEFENFSKDMADFARNAYKNNWVDAAVKKGKVGGAYDEDFAKGHQSRILVNFTGSFSDIITLAHETGHAYHFSCMKNKPAVFFDYPMTLAETASTFAETIVKQDLIKASSDTDKILLLEAELQDTAQVLVDILSRFYFEKSVFEERKNSQLNAEDFCRLMTQAQEATYGPGLNEERHPYMWAVKSHYYITDFDFYNYPYAFGQLFSSALYQKSLTEGPSFADTYKVLLSDTGSMSCESLCEKYGFDITKKDFWLSGMKSYLEEIKTFSDFAESFDSNNCL